MSFQVDPAALRRAADLYTAHVGQLSATADYNAKHGAFDWTNAGLIMKAADLHNNLTDLLTQRLREASELMRRSADGLRAAAAAYEHTDASAAARLDATYPGPVLPPSSAPVEVP
ncbi:type VII secretion target [Hamadaea sp. NPDC050747]|uniref:type VII secretion target n=1 Tax=Hamadaea sp. NPDC050747 TaxID=3155789 RepID=UPI0033FF2680